MLVSLFRFDQLLFTGWILLNLVNKSETVASLLMHLAAIGELRTNPSSVRQRLKAT